MTFVFDVVRVTEGVVIVEVAIFEGFLYVFVGFAVSAVEDGLVIFDSINLQIFVSFFRNVDLGSCQCLASEELLALIEVSTVCIEQADFTVIREQGRT